MDGLKMIDAAVDKKLKPLLDRLAKLEAEVFPAPKPATQAAPAAKQ